MAEKPGLQLRVWRVRREMKQGDLAVELGISQTHLSAIEGSTALPGRDLCIRIEDMTGIPARDWSTDATEAETTTVEDTAR